MTPSCQALAALRGGPSLRRYPRAVVERAAGPVARLVRLGAGRQGRAAGGDDRLVRARRWARATAPARCSSRAGSTSPLFAAMVNAAASHVAEQDDVHNGSVFHPGGGGVSAGARASRRRIGASGRDCSPPRSRATRSASASANFSAARTTRCSTPPAPPARSPRRPRRAACSARSRDAMLHAFGSAGTQAAGLWEFLRDAADSKQLHTAKAAADGLMAAYLAQRRLHRREAHPRRRARHGGGHVERRRSGAADRSASARAGRWPRPRSSSTPPAATRTRPPMRCSQVMQRARACAPTHIARVTAHVHQGAIDVLGPGRRPADGAPGEVLDGHRARR